jgi:hypothetical protein
MLITKNQNLNLDAFLYSITYPSNKEINKYSINSLGDTNNVKISLNNFLDYDSIKIYFKLHIFPHTNRIILNITFKFIAKLNMQVV